jgi:hypothetical protein
MPTATRAEGTESSHADAPSPGYRQHTGRSHALHYPPGPQYQSTPHRDSAAWLSRDFGLPFNPVIGRWIFLAGSLLLFASVFLKWISISTFGFHASYSGLDLAATIDDYSGLVEIICIAIAILVITLLRLTSAIGLRKFRLFGLILVGICLFETIWRYSKFAEVVRHATDYNVVPSLEFGFFLFAMAPLPLLIGTLVDVD